MSEINLLSSRKYDYLRRNLLQSGVFNNIEIETRTFPDGEHYFRISETQKIFGRPAVYICGTVDDAAILEAYNICCTLVREGCQSLHLVLPYFGYSTMERAVKSGEAVCAKNIARLFSSIPLSAMGNYVYMVDLHSQGTQYYFEQNIHPVHLTSEPVIDKIIQDIQSHVGDIVLASADMGRAKLVEKMSNRLGVRGAYIMKKRISDSQTAVEALNADVKDKNVVIFDDMIRSGTSILNAAQAYKSMGARDVFVACVHGVFIDGAVERMKQSGIIQGIYCTNTHAGVQSLNDDFVKVYDMSEILLKALL